MSFILNQFEVEHAEQQLAWSNDFGPNMATAVETLSRLVEWTNSHSDGWAYWSKPTAASKKLQQLIHDRLFGAWDKRTGEDISDAELKAALTPIKSFLTRQGAELAEVLA